jgi:plasmid maintenance system killer protein
LSQRAFLEKKKGKMVPKMLTRCNVDQRLAEVGAKFCKELVKKLTNAQSNQDQRQCHDPTLIPINASTRDNDAWKIIVEWREHEVNVIFSDRCTSGYLSPVK